MATLGAGAGTGALISDCVNLAFSSACCRKPGVCGALELCCCCCCALEVLLMPGNLI